MEFTIYGVLFLLSYPRRFASLGCGCFGSFGCSFICGGFMIKVMIKETTHKTDMTVKVAWNPPSTAAIIDPAKAPNPKP